VVQIPDPEIRQEEIGAPQQAHVDLVKLEEGHPEFIVQEGEDRRQIGRGKASDRFGQARRIDAPGNVALDVALHVQPLADCLRRVASQIEYCHRVEKRRVLYMKPGRQTRPEFSLDELSWIDHVLYRASCLEATGPRTSPAATIRRNAVRAA